MLARVNAAKALCLQRKQSIDWALIQRDWDDYFKNEAPANWREVFHPLIVGTTRDVNDIWTAELGIQFNIQNLLQIAATEFEAYEMQFSEPILETTQSDLFALLKTAAEQGWGIEQLDNGIEALWDVYLRDQSLTDEERQWFVNRSPRYRVEMVARTESMHAANFGSTELFRAYGAERHEWVATNDIRTRPSHAAAHGQIRVIGQPFEVGGALMLSPLDGSMGAPAGEIVNCRCVTAPLLPEEVPVGGTMPRFISPQERGLEAELNEAQQAVGALPPDTDDAVREVMNTWLQDARDNLQRERDINDTLWRQFGVDPDQATDDDWRLLADMFKQEGYDLYRKYTKDGIREFVTQERGAQASGYMVVGKEQVLVRQGAFSARTAQRMEGELWSDAKESLSEAIGDWLQGLGFSQSDIAKANYDQRRRLLEELGTMDTLKTSRGNVSKIDDVPPEVRERIVGRVDADKAATAAFSAVDPLNLPSLDAYRKMELADTILQTKLGGG